MAAIPDGAALTPPLFPTQLYEAVGELAIFGVLMFARGCAGASAAVRQSVARQPGTLVCSTPRSTGCCASASRCTEATSRACYLVSSPRPRLARLAGAAGGRGGAALDGAGGQRRDRAGGDGLPDPSPRSDDLGYVLAGEARPPLTSAGFSPVRSRARRPAAAISPAATDGAGGMAHRAPADPPVGIGGIGRRIGGAARRRRRLRTTRARSRAPDRRPTRAVGRGAALRPRPWDVHAPAGRERRRAAGGLCTLEDRPRHRPTAQAASCACAGPTRAIRSTRRTRKGSATA